MKKGVWQLKKLKVGFCTYGGSSKGTRFNFLHLQNKQN